MSLKDRIFVTAQDVAREAGVSQAAVSRAFTPGASIAPKTRAKVIAIAEQLGYHPNLLARSLINGRSGIVGVGVGNLENPFFAQTLEMMATAFDRAGWKLLLFPIQEGSGTEPSINEILHYRLDALVLLSVNLTSTLAEECRNARVPVVLYNRTTASDEASSVTGENDVGARTIAAHLLAGGHHRFAFVAGTEGSSTNRAREVAFSSYLVKSGALPPLREQGYFDSDMAAMAVRRLLGGLERPDAIFCANDTMAFAAINVARYEFGLDIGREISIVGYDDAPMAAWPAFSLTSYAQPAEKMVEATVSVIGALRKAPEAHAHVTIEGQLRVRGSTRPISYKR